MGMRARKRAELTKASPSTRLDAHRVIVCGRRDSVAVAVATVAFQFDYTCDININAANVALYVSSCIDKIQSTLLDNSAHRPGREIKARRREGRVRGLYVARVCNT